MTGPVDNGAWSGSMRHMPDPYGNGVKPVTGQEDDLGYGSDAWRLVQKWANSGTVPTAKLGEVLRRYADALDGPDESARRVPELEAENERLRLAVPALRLANETLETARDAAEAEVVRLQAQITAAEKIHAPIDVHILGLRSRWCTDSEGVRFAWPCPTVSALAAVPGGES